MLTRRKHLQIACDSILVFRIYKEFSKLTNKETNQCLFVCLFWLHCVACVILVPRPGIKPMHLALEAQSLNH